VPEPIVELIAQNVATTLATVTTANGYQYNLAVERPHRRDQLPRLRDQLVIPYMGDPLVQDGPLSKTQYQQPFFILFFAAVASGSQVETKVNRITADIIKALMVDRTRGGYAIDTMAGEWAEFDDVPAGMDGRVVQIDVQYRVQQNNPYNQG